MQDQAHVPDRTECINRAVALKAAVELAVKLPIQALEREQLFAIVLDIADHLERWLNCETTESVLK